ncbi:CdaR family protein [Zhouia amylolytica]|uniref:YbbR-like protein n=1 Tax=Zhouia amylolytica AD3 TaxID=1286632 RepID=W2UNW2_9FLAO|nr:CdaR family protein [Zhouia amylolytica]ETN95639.1 hypothetical protein P278_13610 [Zhouia amylolytica AD3]
MLQETKANTVLGWLKRPKSLVFLTFLLVSFILWLLIKLTQIYSYSVSYNVVYKNLPKNKLFLNPPSTRVNVLVEANGFRLLKTNLIDEKASIDLSKVRSHSNKWFLLSNDIETQLKEQYRDIEIKQVLTDSIVFDLGVNKKKKVPVVSNLEINFKTDYGLVDSLIISPSEIWILGPDGLIDSIHYVSTQDMVLKNVQSDIDIETSLSQPDSLSSIEFELKEVNIRGKVNRFSEKMIKVPLLIENIPEGTKVRTFPQQINVICRAPIQNLKLISPDNFLIVADYKEVQEGGGYLIPKLVKKPSNIKEVKLMQTKVEFLLKKEW